MFCKKIPFILFPGSRKYAAAAERGGEVTITRAGTRLLALIPGIGGSFGDDFGQWRRSGAHYTADDRWPPALFSLPITYPTLRLQTSTPSLLTFPLLDKTDDRRFAFLLPPFCFVRPPQALRSQKNVWLQLYQVVPSGVPRYGYRVPSVPVCTWYLSMRF